MKLPVTWANNEWEMRDGVISKATRISPTDTRWQDFTKLPGGTSAHLRDPLYPNASLRTQFTRQIINREIAAQVNCSSEEPEAILTCGGTALGKTSASDLLARNRSFLRIDYDRLKRDLPEYEYLRSLGIREAAQYVQHESAKMAGMLFKEACKRRYNLIFEKTLKETEMTLEEIRKLRKKGYRISLIAAHVLEPEGQVRALKRYMDGGRYVPPDIIRENYRRSPISLAVVKDHVDTFVLLDNNGASFRSVVVIEEKTVKFIDDRLYDNYLKTVGNYRLV